MEEKVLGWIYDDEYYIDKAGSICKRRIEYRQGVYGLSTWFEGLCVSLGYSKPEKAFCTNFFNKTCFEKLVGKNINDLIRYVKANGAKIGRYREKREQSRKECKEYSDLYIAVDTKDIDFYNSGFSVFVLLNTKYSYQQQLSSLKRDKEALIKYTSLKLSEQERGKAKKASNLLPFCYVSDIVLTRRNEVRVTYQIKSEEGR